MKKVGIEKIRVNPTRLSLNLAELAAQRGYDVQHMHSELMAFERGLNPLWEDAVTMAVNAAHPMLSSKDRKSIGLLIVGTETSLDQEKALSSWVHRHLELPASCRHFEIKGACYSGTAALKMASAWLLSGMAKPGQKALVITTDQSLQALHEPWEFINGAASVALLISNEPHFLELEPEKFGIHAQEVSDVIRPLPWIETGNSDQSLFSYMEGLMGAYDDFTATVGAIDFDAFFQHNIYHVPFSGISFRAHKRLMQINAGSSKDAVKASFESKALPSTVFTRRIGASYGGSIFIALLSQIHNAASVQAGDRVGIFSYGSGSCAEYFSGLIGEKAGEIAKQAALDQLLDQRAPVSVEQYEAMETLRVGMSRDADFVPDRETVPGLFEDHYRGRGLLIYLGSKGYYREYAFS